MTIENSEQGELPYPELLQQYRALQSKLEASSRLNRYSWDLYAEISRKLQVYSASVKVAISSLLDRDIFWDSANQYEFFTTIDSSVNQVSELIVLLTLAFRAEAGSLVLKRDPHTLQEILSVTQADANLKFPDLHLDISFPGEGKLALVDYEYLSKALLLLCEVSIATASTTPVHIQATEGDTLWYLDFSGLGGALMDIIDQMHNCKTQPVSLEILSAENILRLHTACEVLHLQEISVEVIEQPGQPQILRLGIPAVSNA